MNAQGSALTDPGRVRTTNEDFFIEDPELGLFVVCDGVSGQKGGGVASRLCAETIRDFIRENRAVIDRYRQDRNPQSRTQMLHLVQKAIQMANAKVHAAGEASAEHQGMATTVEALLAVEDTAVLGHVGDSRCYLTRGGKAHCLTQDHKVGAEMVKQGTWTREEAAKSGYSNVLTRAIGQERFVQPDMLQLELMNGDVFVLCTDGLHDYFEGSSPQQLRDLGSPGAKDSRATSEALVKFALERGGKDNVTVSVVRIGASAASAGATDAAAKAEPAGKGAVALDVMKRSELVGKVPLFRYMSYAELMKILNLVTVNEYQGGETLIQEGTAGTEMFILVSGTVEVVKNTQVLARMQKGDFFGEMCFFDDAPRSASIRAAKGETLVALALTKQDFLPLLRKEGQIAVKFLWAVNQEINQRLRAANVELAAVKATLSSGNVPFQLPEGQ